MTESTAPSRTTTFPTTVVEGRARRWAGGLALAHVLLMLGAFSQEKVAVEHGDAFATIQQAYGEAPLGQTLLAGYVEAVAFLVLVPSIVLLARLLGRRSELGRVAAGSFLGLGVAFVGSTLAVGFPAGAAALYAAHHGVDVGTIAIVNDIRNYGFLLEVALLAAMTLALGIAALADGVHTRWIGWGGVAVGGIGLVVTPFAHNAVSLVWMIWWVGMAVVMIRPAPASVLREQPA